MGIAPEVIVDCGMPDGEDTVEGKDWRPDVEERTVGGNWTGGKFEDVAVERTLLLLEVGASGSVEGSEDCKVVAEERSEDGSTGLLEDELSTLGAAAPTETGSGLAVGELDDSWGR